MWDIVQNTEKQQHAAVKSVTVQSEIRHTRMPRWSANSTWERVEENRHAPFRFYAFRETSKRAIDLTCLEISYDINTIQLTTRENEGRSYRGTQESSCANPIRTKRELVIHPNPSWSLASLTPDTDTLVLNDLRIYLFHINQKFNKNNPLTWPFKTWIMKAVCINHTTLESIYDTAPFMQPPYVWES